jgi:hypothetical protein
MELAVSRSLSEGVVEARRDTRSARSLGVLFVGLVLAACLGGCEGDACVRQSDCIGGQTCRLGRCVVVLDAGDGATPDAAQDAGGDAARLDAGHVDAGASDAGADGGTSDAGAVDAGDVDAGDVDAGDVDAGDVDAGPDAGLDAGAIDAGTDTGM